MHQDRKARRVTQPNPMKALLPLAAATCVNIIALGTVIPLLPFQVKALGGGGFEAAAIFSVFSAFSFLSAPFWGRLSDRIGRKPVMLLSVGATIIAYIWLAHADELWELFASRALAGLTAGWMATSNAYVADVTSAENRAKGMGLLGAAFGIGFTIGPALGALSAGEGTAGYILPAYIAASAAGIGFLIVLFLLREPARHKASEQALVGSLGRVLLSPTMRELFIPYFMVIFVFTAIEGTFALWGAAVLDLGPREVGYFLAFSGIVNAAVQGGLVGRLTTRLGEIRVAFVGVLLLALSALTLAVSESFYGVPLAMFFLAAGMGLHNPAMQSIMTRRSPDDFKGGVMGAAQSCASFARIAGPVLGGLVLQEVAITAPYWIGALLLIPIAALVMMVDRRSPERLKRASS